jgi:transposase
LGGISKRGNKYLRNLLIHGGRAVVSRCELKKDKKSLWLSEKKKYCGSNKAAVALANKNARIMWALLSKCEEYKQAV